MRNSGSSRRRHTSIAFLGGEPFARRLKHASNTAPIPCKVRVTNWVAFETPSSTPTREDARPAHRPKAPFTAATNFSSQYRKLLEKVVRKI